MSDWLEQYSGALGERDTREKANKPYIDAYTKLADRTAPPPPSPPAGSPPSPLPNNPTTDPEALLTTLRADLAQTQKARHALHASLTQTQALVSTLQSTQQTTTSALAALTKQKELLERRLQDRDDELRGKGKLVQDAQDEMVALELQLNLAEAGRGRAEALARELTLRWNRRMEGEARRMNEESGF